MKRLGLWLRINSLWVAALGLMLASSGLDGAWLAKMMIPGQGWMGYVLNTTSDVAGCVIIYWFGVFRQSPKNTKRYKLALVLLPAEIVAVAYSWYFAYLQLMLVLPTVMQGDVRWVAVVSAGFIPLMLAFIGWAQALLAGKWDDAKAPTEDAPVKMYLPQKATEPATEKCYVCKGCGEEFPTPHKYAAHKRWHCKETGK